MDDFANILHRDYGLKPQGKSAPMTSSAKPAAASLFSSSDQAATPASIYRTSSGPKQKAGSSRNNRNSNSILGEPLDEDVFFGSSNGFSATRGTYGSAPSDAPATYDDVFGGPPKFTAPSYPPMPSSTSQQNSSSQSYDDIFRMPAKTSSSNSTSFTKGSSFPVFDAPLYDDDIFGGVPGIRNAGVVYDDVFSGSSTVGTSPTVLEDLLGISESKDRSSGSQQPVFDSSTTSAGLNAFDDLLPGFGVTEPAKPMPTGADDSFKNPFDGLDKDSYGMPPIDPFDVIHGDDPFNVQQSTAEASASHVSESESGKGPGLPSGSLSRQQSNGEDTSRSSSPHLFKAHSPSNEKKHHSKGRMTPPAVSPTYTAAVEDDSVNRSLSGSNEADEAKRDWNSPRSPPAQNEAPTVEHLSKKSQEVYDDVEEPAYVPKAAESRQADEYWITVEDVKLVTEPTATPPPSRRPPLPGVKHGHNNRRSHAVRGESSFKEPLSRNESPQPNKLSSSRGAPETSTKSTANVASNPYEELEQFASGVSRARKETRMDMSAPTPNEEILEGSAAVSASSIAMKDAMEKARSKMWERGKEGESVAQAEEMQQNSKEVKEDDETKVREAEERRKVREKEEKEREAKALREERDRRRRERERERENEREREREREREKDRIAFERAAVERANAEARERLAAEVRQRAAAERAAAEAREQAAAVEARERAAVEKVTAEARERAGAEARERAAAEAREKAAEAREKAAAERAAAEKAAAERAAAEARERAVAEARERVAAERAASEARARAERAFVERVHAEARERAAEKAAAEARERAAAERAATEARERAAAERAAAAREQQRRSENDLESFFAASSRPASAPRQRSPVKQGTSTDGRQFNKVFSTEGPHKASTAASGARKVTRTSSNDDFTSLFGPAVPSAGEFQEVDGEAAERRRARWERYQRTAERAAKALDEKNQRDLQSQRDQAERHRAGEILDAEIKRWAAGKEGNLRALLSTLQYVLWPECGWQAVSLTDLITPAAVKKVYRKATLFVHPDKVQQKGATIQQKYIAEKVFDLLKEAWNKFNSEELF